MQRKISINIKNLSAIIITILLFGCSLMAQDPDADSHKGEVMVFNSSNKNKGIVLPKVELKSVDSYLPIKGKPIDGLIVYNTESSEALSIGLYIWSNDKWLKFINESDENTVVLDPKTGVYVGDLTLDQVNKTDEIKDAAPGSIYLNAKTRLIYKKTDDIWIEFTDYIDGNFTIGDGLGVDYVSNPNARSIDKVLVVKGEKDVESSSLGVNINIDRKTLNINNSEAIIAKESDAIWNASKLKDIPILKKDPIDGNMLAYSLLRKDAQGGVLNPISLTGGKGLEINIKDGATFLKSLIDTATISKTSDGALAAKNDNPIWNANKLNGIPVESIEPINVNVNNILSYDNKNNIWKNKTLDGSDGISIDLDKNNNFIIKSFEIDTNTLDIVNKKLTAKKSSAIWNADRINNIGVTSVVPSGNGQFLYYNASDSLWKYSSLVGGEGIRVDTDTNDNINLALVFNNNLFALDGDNKLVVKNDNPVWNAKEILGYEIASSFKDGNALRFKNNIWQGIADGWLLKGNEFDSSSSQIIGFSDSENKNNLELRAGKGNPIVSFVDSKFTIYSKDKDVISLDGKNSTIILDGKNLFFKNLVSQKDPLFNFSLMLSKNTDGSIVNYNSGGLWLLNGNDNKESKYSIGIKNSKGKNLIFKTAGKERIKISENIENGKGYNIDVYPEDGFVLQGASDKITPLDITKEGEVYFNKNDDNIGNTGFNTNKAKSVELIAKDNLGFIAKNGAIRFASGKGPIKINSNNFKYIQKKNINSYLIGVIPSGSTSLYINKLKITNTSTMDTDVYNTLANLYRLSIPPGINDNEGIYKDPIRIRDLEYSITDDNFVPNSEYKVEALRVYVPIYAIQGALLVYKIEYYNEGNSSNIPNFSQEQDIKLISNYRSESAQILYASNDTYKNGNSTQDISTGIAEIPSYKFIIEGKSLCPLLTTKSGKIGKFKIIIKDLKVF